MCPCIKTPRTLNVPEVVLDFLLITVSLILHHSLLLSPYFTLCNYLFNPFLLPTHLSRTFVVFDLILGPEPLRFYA